MSNRDTIALPIEKTFDLPYRASLAHRAILNSTDEERGFIPYQNTFINSAPPEMRHLINGAEWSEIPGRSFIGCILARRMNGIHEASRQESAFLGHLRRFQDACPDGVCAQLPCPWHPGEDVATNAESHRMMMESWLLNLSEGAEFEFRIERMIEGFFKHRANWKPIAGADHREIATDFDTSAADGLGGWHIQWILDALVAYAEQAGSSRARDLADAIVEAHPKVNDATWMATGQFSGHAHGHLTGVIGLLRYAAWRGDRSLILSCQRSYEWYLGRWGSPLGWCAEMVGQGPISREDCEVCTICSLIELAILLGDSCNDARYYNDAETFMRNQLLEQQLVDLDWIPPQVASAQAPAPSPRQTYEDVLDRSIGIFHGDAAPNDLVGNNSPCHFRFMTGCCTSWGVRALHMIWNRTVTVEDNRVTVLFPFLRQHSSAAVTPHSPVGSTIKVEVRESHGKLRLRLPTWSRSRSPGRFTDMPVEMVLERWGPNWMDPDCTSVLLNGRPAQYRSHLGFMEITAEAGDIIDLQVPFRWDKTTEVIGGREYSLEWIGNTCVGISPPGLIRPLYQRASMRETLPKDTAQVKTAKEDQCRDEALR